MEQRDRDTRRVDKPSRIAYNASICLHQTHTYTHLHTYCGAVHPAYIVHFWPISALISRVLATLCEHNYFRNTDHIFGRKTLVGAKPKDMGAGDSR